MRYCIRTVWVGYARSEGGNDEVSFESNDLISITEPLAVVSLFSAVELHGADTAAVCDDLCWVHERQKFTFLFLRQLHLRPHQVITRR